jgi:hypothetical protein
MRVLARGLTALTFAALGLVVPVQVLTPVVASASPLHIVVIVMENQAYDKIVGRPEAPYINSLIANGRLFTNYVAVVNGSLHNYLAMTSGLTTRPSPPSANVFQSIDGTGGTETWRQFQESMSGNCGAGSTGTIPGTKSSLYTRTHDPDYYYRANTTCSLNNVPLTTSTFVPSNLPDFSLVVPNQCNDMHSRPKGGLPCPAYFGQNPDATPIAMGDFWLSQFVPPILAQPGVIVLLTWDEGGRNTIPIQHIVTLEVGSGIPPGTTDGNAYNHYGLEAGLYAHFGLGTPPNNGASATPLPLG